LIVWYYFEIPLSKRVVPPIGGIPYISLIKKKFENFLKQLGDSPEKKRNISPT